MRDALTADVGVEEVRQANAQRFGGQPEQVSIAVEGEAAARGDRAQSRLVAPVEDPLPEPVGPAPDHLERVRTVGARGDDFHALIADDAGEAHAWNDVFQPHHARFCVGPSTVNHSA